MLPPPAPARHESLPNSPRNSSAPNIDNTGVGVGPGQCFALERFSCVRRVTEYLTGPIRHPRPLTAAELHLEVEKEQESIVRVGAAWCQIRTDGLPRLID
jgi:hypothetical protein